MTRLIVIFSGILLPMTVPAGNGSAANGSVADPTGPAAPKKPVVLTLDGICPYASFLPDALVPNNKCWDNYLRSAFSSDLTDYDVASFSWPGDAKETHEVLPSAEKTIRGFYEVARRRGQPFQIIAHSWGSVLAYIVLKNNPGIQVETLITLGSPLQSQREVSKKYTSRYAGTTITKPGNVRRWVNYWAWNDLISGPIDMADKNFQLDGQQSRTGYDTRLAATLDFHEQYYTAWKASIIADLSGPATADIVIATECAIINDRDYSRHITLVATPWIQLNRGQNRDGYFFSSDGSLSFQRHLLAHNVPVSGRSSREGDQWIYAQSVALSPKSPSGRFSILVGCEEPDLEGLCWALFVVNHDSKRIERTFAGKYGPERLFVWIAGDDEYAVFRYTSHGETRFFRVHLPTGKSTECGTQESQRPPSAELILSSIKTVAIPEDLRSFKGYPHDTVKINSTFQYALSNALEQLPSSVLKDHSWWLHFTDTVNSPNSALSTPIGILIRLDGCKPHDCASSRIRAIYDPFRGYLMLMVTIQGYGEWIVGSGAPVMRSLLRVIRIAEEYGQASFPLTKDARDRVMQALQQSN